MRLKRLRTIKRPCLLPSPLALPVRGTTRQVTGMLKNENGEVVMGQIANAYQGTAIDREAEAVSQRLQKENGMNKANARVAGFITALGKSGDYRDQQNLRSLLGTATGMNFSPMSDPDQNKGIAGERRECKRGWLAE